MTYRVKVKKTLHTDNNKTFSVGTDIAFKYKGISYIGEIKKIGKKKLKLINIEITDENKHIHKYSKEMVVLLKDIEPESCQYVYYD